MRISALLIVVVAMLTSVLSFSQNTSQNTMKLTANEPTILFVCEHGAAKSVIAAAYFDKLAKARGLKYRAVFRGTNPDAELAPSAVKGLTADGLDAHGKPEMVTKKDMDAASGIVTMGCALPGKDAVTGKVSEWNDIPSVGQNYELARADIVKRVQSLVDDLAKKEPPAKSKKKAKPDPRRSRTLLLDAGQSRYKYISLTGISLLDQLSRIDC